MSNQSPLTTKPELAALFQAIEEEFLLIASKSERYLESWEGLTPYRAVDLVLRRRSDFDWLHNENVEQYDVELSTYIEMTWSAVAALQQVIGEAKALDTPSKIESKRESWSRISPDVVKRYRDPANLAAIRLTYERMTAVALAARVKKLSEPPGVRRVFRTYESSLAIEQIRTSEYSRETVFIFDVDRLPSGLQHGIHESKCLAVTMPDEWIARCDSFVDFSAPSLSFAENGQFQTECVLQLASEAVRLEALEVSRFLHQFDYELPVVFVGREVSALAVHKFSGLADCASIHATLAHIGELDGLIPVFSECLSLDDGSVVKPCVKSRVLNAAAYGGRHSGRALDDAPDPIDEVPF
ncbi:hypothetical protein B0G81_2381 [Paraburkholderia sp. BL6665CI2N2]|nr:hypothetical protein B0G81_2381 [Paraburkholderia sp. BL6665CI2N2]